VRQLIQRAQASEELYRIFELDSRTPASLGAVRARVHADDLQFF